MTAALARDAVVLDFTAPSAVALAAERHNRMRRLRKSLYRSLMPTRPADVIAAANLGADSSEIWWRLMTRLWLEGHLPGDAVGLAQVAKVSRRRWERHAPAIFGLFQRTGDGRWTDRDLLAFRDRIVARFDFAEAHLGARHYTLLQLREQARDFDEVIFELVRPGAPPLLTIGVAAECAAQFELTRRQLQAWRLLLLHLLEHGQLPFEQAALARICRLRRRSFVAMEPMLSLHLDRQTDGRWSHRDVVAGRGQRPIRLIAGGRE